MELSGGEIIIEALKEEGVSHIFGYPGGAVLHIYDALYKQEDVQHILVRHEQGATHAADAYARATGKPGVVLVTSGPGATNAVTGIATAFMDSVPMVIITGQVHRAMIGSDAFQEVDSVGITRPCVKHNFLVQNLEDLASTMRKAFFVATSGRPGPVVVDIPKDITAPEIKIPFSYPREVQMRSYNPTVVGHTGQIHKAVELLIKARRPMIYTGGGVIASEASEQLTEFTRMLGYPITQTLMGLGSYPATDEQFLGMLGMHGTYEANMGMHECDVLLAVGARFDDRVTGTTADFCPHAKIIHIDIDPASISKNIRVDVPIVGDVKQVLEVMLQELRQTERRANPDDIAAWWKQINEWRATNCLEYDRNSDLIKPQFVVEKLCEVTGGDAYIASDVGQHQMFVAQFYKFNKPRRWLNSGGLGTMGFGLPGALGAKLAFPDEDVVCVTGEASIQMCIQELSTAKQFGLPIKVVNLNNRYMGMVRQWQELLHGERYSHSYSESLPDFVKLAEAMGARGIRCEDPALLDDKIMEMIEHPGPVLFDCRIEKDGNCLPMIPSGSAHNEMILGQITGNEISETGRKLV